MDNSLVISSLDYARIEALVRDAVAGNTVARAPLCVLKSTIDRARVVEPWELPQDVASMNSTVRLRHLDDDSVESFTLVYPAFADFTENRLSVLTAVGAAMLGQQVGEVIEWETPVGRARARIEEVEYQPETAGQYDI